MIISRTPYRISFFGGGTDYPQWYKKNKSSTISVTINHYSYITVKNLPNIFKYKFRIRYYFREEVNNLNKIKHPVIKAVLKRKKIKEGLDIVHHGDLPARTGIGTSASFSVGLLNVINSIKKIKISKKKLAKEVLHLEHKILKEHTGSQDQIAATYGGLNKIDFYKNNFKCKRISLSKKKMKELENWIQIFFTGKQRNSAGLEKSKINNSLKNYKINNQIYSITNKAYNILKSNKKNFMYEFSALLNQQWFLKKSLSKKVSNNFIDKIYSKGIKAGAVGGKILGAGSCGFMMFLTPPHKKKQVSKFVKLPEVKVKFDFEGSKLVHRENF